MSEPEVFDDGPVRHVRFNRPDVLNALRPADQEAVLVALEAAAQDPEVRVVALSGAGPAFSAGADLRAEPDYPERLADRQVDLALGDARGVILLHEVLQALWHLPKPVVAVMHGHAIGGGYDYSLACDVRIATASCRYGDPRILRGMPAAEGWSYLLPRLLPLGRLPEVAYRGRLLTGAEAADIGLVHHVVPDDGSVLEHARPVLDRLAKLDPHAYAAAKRRLHAGLHLRFEDALVVS